MCGWGGEGHENAGLGQVEEKSNDSFSGVCAGDKCSGAWGQATKDVEAQLTG